MTKTVFFCIIKWKEMEIKIRNRILKSNKMVKKLRKIRDEKGNLVNLNNGEIWKMKKKIVFEYEISTTKLLLDSNNILLDIGRQCLT